MMLRQIANRILRVAALVMAAAVSISTAAAEPAPGSAPRRVLFIGNSYTYVNNIPGIVAEIARANRQTLEITLHAPGGRTFEGHWTDGKAAALIGEGGWDAVVLQNQSYEPVGAPEKMIAFAEKLGAEIDRTNPNARKILYETWAYRDMKKLGESAKRFPASVPPANPGEMQDRLDAAYRETATRIHAEIAPVGPAWRAALAKKPAMALHGADGSHPSPLGSYFAAAVIHATLFRGPAANLPGTVTVPASASDPDAAPATIRVSAAERALMKQIVESLAGGSVANPRPSPR